MLSTDVVYKIALDKIPYACCFVEMNDKFVYANVKWCKLVGYSESELIQKTWQEITHMEDVGGDTAETEAVKNQEKESYYLEKEYIRKNGEKVFIGLFVYRYPTYGPQKGYIVFAYDKNEEHEELAELRKRIAEIEASVFMLLQNQSNIKSLEEKLDKMSNDQDTFKEILVASMGHSGSIHVGDSSNSSSESNVENQSKIFWIIAAVFGFLATALISLVAMAAYAIYVTRNNPELDRPRINQPVLTLPMEDHNE